MYVLIPLELRNLSVPRQVTILLNLLGEESYLTGGCIRDAVLEKTPKDWDVATNHTPEKVMELCAVAGFRIVPLGIKHGTVSVMVSNENGDVLPIEVTTFRSDGIYSDSRRPDTVRFVSSVEEDISRRDFTMNSMAFNPVTKVFIDPFCGYEDIKDKRIKAVGNPEDRFKDDPLRIMRAIRFASVLGFSIDEKTMIAATKLADEISEISMERIRDEINKAFISGASSRDMLEWMRAIGVLKYILPEVYDTIDVDQNKYHQFSVWEHTVRVVKNISVGSSNLFWASTLHDIGKIPCRVELNGRITFLKHEDVGAEMAEKILTRLKFPNENREEIVFLVRNHMWMFESKPSNYAIRRFIQRVSVGADDKKRDVRLKDLFALRVADVMAKRADIAYPFYVEEIERRVKELIMFKDAFSRRDLEINGDDLIALGVKGVVIGDILEEILEVVLQHPEQNTKENLKLIAQRILKDKGDSIPNER